MILNNYYILKVACKELKQSYALMPKIKANLRRIQLNYTM
jgi:hypothetical protein